MGIDVYLRWDKMTARERKAQFTGFSVTAGGTGYLREAYHGGPYATRVLVPEAFEDKRKHMCDCGDPKLEKRCPPCRGVAIPATTLRERLPQVVLTALLRERIVYGNDINPGRLNLDALPTPGALADALKAMVQRMTDYAKEEVAVPPEIMGQAMSQMVLWRDCGWLPPVAESFEDFVLLAEAKEKAGLHPTVYVSA